MFSGSLPLKHMLLESGHGVVAWHQLIATPFEHGGASLDASWVGIVFSCCLGNGLQAVLCLHEYHGVLPIESKTEEEEKAKGTPMNTVP